METVIFISHIHDELNNSKIQYYHCKGLGHVVHECPSVPLNENRGEAVKTSNLPPKYGPPTRGDQKISED